MDIRPTIQTDKLCALINELQHRAAKLGYNASQVSLESFLMLSRSNALVARVKGRCSATFNIDGMEIEYALNARSKSAAKAEALYLVEFLNDQGLSSATLQRLRYPARLALLGDT